MAEIHIEELWQKAKQKYSFSEGIQLKNEQSEILKCLLEEKDFFCEFVNRLREKPLFYASSLSEGRGMKFFTSFFVITNLLGPLMFHSSYKYWFKLVISLHLLRTKLGNITWIIELFNKYLLNNYIYCYIYFFSSISGLDSVLSQYLWRLGNAGKALNQHCTNVPCHIVHIHPRSISKIDTPTDFS